MNIRNEISLLVKTKNEITDNNNIKVLFRKLTALSKKKSIERYCGNGKADTT